MYDTSIKVGASSDITMNALCKSLIQVSGIYTCDMPLTGSFVGLIREGLQSDYYSWAEIRAYEYAPFVITSTMLTSTTTPNASLTNSLSFSMTVGAETLMSDSIFSDTSNTTPVYWMVNFGSSKYVKAVLVVGRPDSPNSYDWYITFGNSSTPTTNLNIYSVVG